MKKIAVLITSFNRVEKTLFCLELLFKQDHLNEFFTIDVFLVDDNSSDGTSESVKSKFAEVNLIKGNGNLFWNGGMHLAWKIASEYYDFDYYMWLNDDTFLKKNALDELFKITKLNSAPVIVCGAICSDTNTFSYGLVRINSTHIYPNSKLENGEIINGNCVLIPKEIFKKNGNIDSIFPHAIGDHDYGLRAIKKGFKILTTEVYIGQCNQNERLPLWCYPETPIKKRIKALYSPLGNSHPFYYFRYELRHFGLFVAVKHFLSIHLRVFVPSLWKN